MATRQRAGYGRIPQWLGVLASGMLLMIFYTSWQMHEKVGRAPAPTQKARRTHVQQVYPAQGFQGTAQALLSKAGAGTQHAATGATLDQSPSAVEPKDAQPDAHATLRLPDVRSHKHGGSCGDDCFKPRAAKSDMQLEGFRPLRSDSQEHSILAESPPDTGVLLWNDFVVLTR